MKQLSFSDAEYGGKRKQTRREVFLAERDRAVPWARLEALIEPHYPKVGFGRQPYRLATMLRIHCLQQWYGLSDPAMEEELYEIASMRRFAGLSLARGSVPDETTILNFRHLLERYGLARELFETVKAHLQDAGLLLRQGTIVDATIIAAPSSTKNSTGERDPEMHQTKKGNQGYFGMKAHVGTDAESGLVHSVIGTPANAADVTQAHDLLHGEETVAFGDAGYTGVEERPEARHSPQWTVTEKIILTTETGVDPCVMPWHGLGRQILEPYGAWLCAARPGIADDGSQVIAPRPAVSQACLISLLAS